MVENKEGKSRRLEEAQQMLQQTLDHPWNFKVPSEKEYAEHQRAVEINMGNANRFAFQIIALKSGYEPADYYRLDSGHPIMLTENFGSHEDDVRFPSYLLVMGKGLKQFPERSEELWRKIGIPPSVPA